MKIGDAIEGKDDTHKCNKNQGSGFDGEEEEEDKEEEKVVTKPLEILMWKIMLMKLSHSLPTTNYLPTSFEYFYCVEYDLLPSLCDRFIDDDNDYYFHAISSNFVSGAPSTSFVSIVWCSQTKH